MEFIPVNHDSQFVAYAGPSDGGAVGLSSGHSWEQTMQEANPMTTRYIIPALIAATMLLSAGCSQQTIQSATKDMSKDIQVANQDVNNVGAKARPELNKLDAQARPALSKLDIGMRVTAALRANANLPSTIRVDAGGTGVRLRGKVETQHQKNLAGQIAQQTLPPGLTVSNQLTVKPPSGGA
jgi:osmotically-inducible protein OsmY